MKAGIALDDWKLPVFRKRLTEAEFEYEDAGEFQPGLTMLTVVMDEDKLDTLRRVLEAAHAECKEQGKP